MATDNFEAFKTSFYCLCALAAWLLDEKLVSCIIILITFVSNFKKVDFRTMPCGKFKSLMVMSIIIILPTTFYIKIKKENEYKELSREKNCMGRVVCVQLKIFSRSIYNNKTYIVKITNAPTIINRYIGREMVAINRCAYKFKINETYNLVGIISEYDKNNYGIEINKKISSSYKDRDAGLKYSIKKRLIEDSGLTQNSKALVLAFLSGDKSLLSSHQFNVYRKTGTLHLFAVSGLHIGCFFAVVYFLMKLSCKINRITLIISIIILCSYLDLADYSISSVRAYIMICVCSLGKILFKRTDAIKCLLITFFVIVLHDVSQIFTISFQLSFGVVLTICCSLHNDAIQKYGNKFYRFVIVTFCVSWSAFWGSFPILVSEFGYVVPFSIFINMFIAILVGALLCLFFIYAFVGFLGGNDYLSQFVNLIISLFESTLTPFMKFPLYEISQNLNLANYMFYWCLILYSTSIINVPFLRMLSLPIFCFSTISLANIN